MDAHVVRMTRNCFNPVFGTGGNVGKRNFAEAWKNSVKLLSKPEKAGWLDATLAGQADRGMPDLRGGGTWFVFANKTFNSGQGWYREGQLSPWSFLLSMEGAFLLVGGVNRRLGSGSRPYAVFPFVSEPSQPETDGEIGLARAEFWAPIWNNPATLGEVKMLLHRGLARLGGRAAQAPMSSPLPRWQPGSMPVSRSLPDTNCDRRLRRRSLKPSRESTSKPTAKAQTGHKMAGDLSRRSYCWRSSSPVGSTGFPTSRAIRNRRASSSD